MSSPSIQDAGLELTIGQVSRRTGKAPSAIRYYEGIGLLPPPRRVSGRRRYSPHIVRTLAVIETAQRAGLTLSDAALLLSASPEDQRTIERLRAVAERRLPEVVALIVRAELVRSWLEQAARCACPSLEECPLFEEGDLLPERPRGITH